VDSVQFGVFFRRPGQPIRSREYSIEWKCDKDSTVWLRFDYTQKLICVDVRWEVLFL